MSIDNKAAQTATSALQALPFKSLIGAPLDACINAQANAAKTSWEFIQNVGLTEDPNTHEKKAVNVTFQYNKNGEMINLVVPLLTIVPIPFLAINEVAIDFKANISASASTFNETSSSEELEAGGSIGGRVGWGPYSASFNAHANYSSKKDSKATADSKYSVEYTMDVNVKGGQADMPAGLASILNILQSSLTEAPVGGGITISPKNSIIQAAAGAKLYIEATAKDSNGLLQKDVPIKFDISNISAGLVLKDIVATRGTREGVAQNTMITVISDENGVAGITLEVKKIEYKSYSAGIMDIVVTAKINNPNDPRGGTKDVTTSGKIRTTEALPPSRGTIKLSETSFTLDSATTSRTVAVGYTNEAGDDPGKTGEPVKIKASSSDSNICTVTPKESTQNSSDKIDFTINRVTVGKAKVEFETTDGAYAVVDVVIT
ncbi:UNVERIFIED_CONTAM: uncharacterized protein DUF2589 [Acetivibrio alkalicellulosi]